MGLFNSELRTRIVKEEESLNGESFKVFTVYIKGRLRNLSSTIRYTTWAVDVTGNREDYLICELPAMQYEDTSLFRFTTDWIDVPYIDAVMSESMYIAKIPIDFLVFPRKGDLNLKFVVVIEDLTYGEVNSCEYTIHYYNKEKGYLDRLEERDKIEKSIVRIGVFISGASSTYDKEIAKEVIKYIENVSKDHDGIIDNEKKKSLEKEIKNSIYKSNAQDRIELIKKETKSLNELGDKNDIIKALEFYAKLVTLNKNYDETDKSILEEIIKMLDLSEKQVQEIIEKKINVNLLSSDSEKLKLIGITEGMSKEEKKRHLKDEYRKWNQRITNSDKSIRDQANNMLELISTERSKLN